MTPSTIIQQAAAEGVILALSDTGAIKAAGSAEAVSRWIPTIRIHKADLLVALAEESAIRRWLAHIEEDDPAIIDEVIQKCRGNPEARGYFLHRAETEVVRQTER